MDLNSNLNLFSLEVVHLNYVNISTDWFLDFNLPYMHVNPIPYSKFIHFLKSSYVPLEIFSICYFKNIQLVKVTSYLYLLKFIIIILELKTA